jgi:hypothetical protein
MRYWWKIPYILAILQTDEPSMHNALFEAIAALEQRRHTPYECLWRNRVSGSGGRTSTADRGKNLKDV